MSKEITLESIQHAIEEHVRKCIEEIILNEIRDISSNVTYKVRNQLGQIVTRCLSMYEIHLDRSHLVITVNTKDL